MENVILFVIMLQVKFQVSILEYEKSSCNVMCHLVKKLKSHEGSERVTKENVKDHYTLCYK